MILYKKEKKYKREKKQKTKQKNKWMILKYVPSFFLQVDHNFAPSHAK